jgi:hypothetical protein
VFLWNKKLSFNKQTVISKFNHFNLRGFINASFVGGYGDLSPVFSVTSSSFIIRIGLSSKEYSRHSRYVFKIPLFSYAQTKCQVYELYLNFMCL